MVPLLKLENPHDRASAASFLEWIGAAWIARMLKEALELGLAELLEAGPRTIDELAKATGKDPKSLHSFMHALALLGLFEEDPEHRFTLKPPDEHRASGPEYLRAYTAMLDEPWQSRTWENILYNIRRGRGAFDQVVDKTLWQHFAGERGAGLSFNEAMAGFTVRSSSKGLP